MRRGPVQVGESSPALVGEPRSKQGGQTRSSPSWGAADSDPAPQSLEAGAQGQQGAGCSLPTHPTTQPTPTDCFPKIM